MKTSSIATACSMFAWLVITACSPQPAAPQQASDTPLMPEPETRAYRACQADADCVYVQNGCCDCVNGGGVLAVHRDKVSAFRATFQCDQAECTARLALDGCDTGVASCRAGLCEYSPK